MKAKLALGPPGVRWVTINSNIAIKMYTLIVWLSTNVWPRTNEREERDGDYDEQGLPEKREGPSCAKLGHQELIIISTTIISTTNMFTIIISTSVISTIVILLYTGVHSWRLQQRNKWLWRGYHHPRPTVQVIMHDPFSPRRGPLILDLQS